MSIPEELATQLDAAIYGLHNIRLLVSDGGRSAFDASEDRRDLDLLWVTSVRETPVLLRILERLHDQLGTDQVPEPSTASLAAGGAGHRTRSG